MGYRSRVAICTTPTLVGILENAWAEAGGLNDYDVGCSRSDPEVAYMVWDEVKWYSSSPEVLAVELMLQDDEAPHGEPWSFVRVGEEMGDWEHLYSDDCPDRYMIYPDQTVIFGADGNFGPLVPSYGRAALDDMLMMLFLDVQLRDPEAARKYRDNFPYIDKLCRQRGEA